MADAAKPLPAVAQRLEARKHEAPKAPEELKSELEAKMARAEAKKAEIVSKRVSDAGADVARAKMVAATKQESKADEGASGGVSEAKASS